VIQWGVFIPATALGLDPPQRQVLEALVRAGATPQVLARKCQVILLAADGVPNTRIASQTGLSRPTVIATRAAFARDGVEAIRRRQTRKRSRRVLTPELEQKILDITLQTRPPGAIQWSVRTLARHLGVTRTLVHGVWQRCEVRPHRVERFKLSNDPKFDEKVCDIAGLYLSPPDRALVLCVDANNQIQALARTAPIQPLRPERQRHDYKRLGTTMLFAALNVLNGKMIGSCLPRHRAKQFIRFLNQLETRVPQDQEIHLIMDKYSSHKSAAVQRWLNPKKPHRFHFHFTPTSGSWFNQVEHLFGLITDRMIRRGTFHRVENLERAIYRWLANWNHRPKPFAWKVTADVFLDRVRSCEEAIVNN
jgi:transposase